MIEIKKLKELVRLMVDNELTELDLRDDAQTIVVKRGGPPLAAPPVVSVQPALGQAANAPGGAPPAAEAQPDEDAGLHAITSPMVGTFYSSPDPESPAYIKRGDEVDPETVVCIVEAMKVFSEIKAECAGTVEKVLVKNGEAVEFGQRLFLVRAS